MSETIRISETTTRVSDKSNFSETTKTSSKVGEISQIHKKFDAFNSSRRRRGQRSNTICCKDQDKDLFQRENNIMAIETVAEMDEMEEHDMKVRTKVELNKEDPDNTIQTKQNEK